MAFLAASVTGHLIEPRIRSVLHSSSYSEVDGSLRPVTVGRITLIGKESNRLEERSRGELTVDDLDERITTYDDHDEWYRVTLTGLRGMGSKAVAVQLGFSERRVRDVLSGKVLPHSRNRERYESLVQ